MYKYKKEQMEKAFDSFKNLVLSRATGANIHKINNKLGNIRNCIDLLGDYIKEKNEKEIKLMLDLIQKEMKDIRQIVYKNSFLKGL